MTGVGQHGNTEDLNKMETHNEDYRDDESRQELNKDKESNNQDSRAAPSNEDDSFNSSESELNSFSKDELGLKSSIDDVDMDYVCTLDDATLRKAQSELGEDPQTRLQQVAELRRWLDSQEHIRADTDTNMLLTVLRACKFRQDRARQKIIGMLTLGSERPSWFKDVDTKDPEIISVFEDLYVIALPGRDDNGCRVVLYRMGSFDTSGKRYNKGSIMRAFSALFIHMLRCETDQVNGFVYVIDADNFSTRQQLFWTPNDLRTIATLWQKALPTRFKRFHFIRMGFTFDIILRLLMPFLSKKFKERIIMHGSDIAELRQYIPDHMLPDEYLPPDHEGPSAGPMQQIVDRTMAELQEPETKAYIARATSSQFSMTVNNSRWAWLQSWLRAKKPDY